MGPGIHYDDDDVRGGGGGGGGDHDDDVEHFGWAPSPANTAIVLPTHTGKRGALRRLFQYLCVCFLNNIPKQLHLSHNYQIKERLFAVQFFQHLQTKIHAQSISPAAAKSCCCASVRPLFSCAQCRHWHCCQHCRHWHYSPHCRYN